MVDEGTGVSHGFTTAVEINQENRKLRTENEKQRLTIGGLNREIEDLRHAADTYSTALEEIRESNEVILGAEIVDLKAKNEKLVDTIQRAHVLVEHSTGCYNQDWGSDKTKCDCAYGILADAVKI